MNSVAVLSMTTLETLTGYKYLLPSANAVTAACAVETEPDDQPRATLPSTPVPQPVVVHQVVPTTSAITSALVATLATGTHFIKSGLPVCPVFPFRAVYSSKTSTLRRFTQFMQFMQTEQFMQFMRFVLVYQKTGPDRSRPVLEQTA